MIQKKLKRFFRDKHGITPVLSNLLLMVVAVAAMSIATTSTYVITTNLRETMSERIVIEDLWFTNQTHISMYLRNIGKVPVHISSVYVNGTSQAFTSPFILDIGKHGWLNISYSRTFGRLFYILAITTRGMRIGGYYKTL